MARNDTDRTFEMLFRVVAVLTVLFLVAILLSSAIATAEMPKNQDNAEPDSKINYIQAVSFDPNTGPGCTLLAPINITVTKG